MRDADAGFLLGRLLSGLGKAKRGGEAMANSKRRFDTDRIDDAVLALLCLGLHDGFRAWKGFFTRRR